MKNYYKFYIVNWKETTLREDEVLETECGTCEEGFKSEAEAIAKVKELVEDKIEECIEELDYDADSVSDSYNENGDYGCVNAGSNTYEYSVYEIIVDKQDGI